MIIMTTIYIVVAVILISVNYRLRKTVTKLRRRVQCHEDRTQKIAEISRFRLSEIHSNRLLIKSLEDELLQYNKHGRGASQGSQK